MIKKKPDLSTFEAHGLILLKGLKTSGCRCGGLPPVNEAGLCTSCVVHDNFRTWFRRAIRRLSKEPLKSSRCRDCGHEASYHEGRCYYEADKGESCNCTMQQYIRLGP